MAGSTAGRPLGSAPSALQAGTTSAAASPPAHKTECPCGSKRHWHPEATGQPTQQNARSGKTAAAWVSPQPGSPLRPLDAATGSGPGFELGFAEVADRYHSPLMPNLQRMVGGIPEDILAWLPIRGNAKHHLSGRRGCHTHLSDLSLRQRGFHDGTSLWSGIPSPPGNGAPTPGPLEPRPG